MSMLKNFFNRGSKNRRSDQRAAQLQDGDGQPGNYGKRGRRGKPLAGLTPVVTPRAEPQAQEDGGESSSEDHTTEQDEKEEKKQRLPGQKHFPDDLLMGRYEFARYLGHGSYGHVCEAVDRETGKKVAIKRVDQVFSNATDGKRLLREMRILRALQNHQAIVDLVDLLPPINMNRLRDFQSIVMVFEFVDTDLSRLIASDQNFTTLHVQYMMYQILLGLKYMHSAQIAHRDLKPANILVNEDCTLKICDFGLSRGFSEALEHSGGMPDVGENQGNSRRKKKMKPKREVTKHVVTRWYRAPEVILLQQRRQLLPAIDMWSVGCIMAELMQMKRENGVPYHDRKPLFPGTSCFPLSARDPFAYADRMDQLNVIFDCIGTPSDEDIAKLTDEKAKKYLRQLPRRDATDLRTKFPGSDDDERDLLQQFIIFDPEQRITIDDALAHRYFNKVRDEAAEVVHEVEQFEFEDSPQGVVIPKIQKICMEEIGIYHPEWLESIEDTFWDAVQADIDKEEARARRSRRS